MPPKHDLSFSSLEEFVNEPIVSEPTSKKPVVETSEAKASAVKPKVVRKNFGPSLIEDWISDSEDEAESKPKIEKKTVKPSFAKIEFVKSKRQVKSPWKTTDKQGVIDNGCSRHMTRNISYLTDFEEIDGGYVAFRGNSKGGKITVENLIDQRVNVIRCDNGTEFKNKEINQFCETKGIKRELSVARTPQQNGAEAVNTVCYVQNRVLLTKPYNKTPYELFLGRKPTLGFIRSFGCPVTILNTLDHLGKFDGKADEGFFFRKAFRVFNSRTRIVEENLHVQFSKNTPNIVGSGPNWLFDIDALTKIYDEKKVTEEPGKEGGDPSKEGERDDQEKDVDVNSTNSVYTAIGSSFVNADGSTFVNAADLLDDPNMPPLEDIVYSDDDEDVGAEADMNNLDAFMPVSPIPTTRVHKDHPVEQIIRDLNSAPQTRRMTKNLKEHGTKWVYRNKKDGRGIVIKNKARLVAQGHTQEEGIDYDEVFALVARIEAIRLFLAYASFKDFVVYQMDVKSAFLYGKIEEEVYICQPPGFEDPDFPDRVYKVQNALYGLHQAPRAWYETLSTYLLDNGFQRGKIDKTLFIRRVKGDILLVQVYVDDIIFGSIKKSLCTEFEKMMHKKF
ncbi:retrovirus-related pol polyprotein from transposon TNT 1-94 [Tanacetum coccineum]